jgi:NADH:ubiquinone oxidoreductase subunit 6 (subunit J)
VASHFVCAGLISSVRGHAPNEKGLWMNLFLLVPLCAVLVLALHIRLRLFTRWQHRITLTLLLVGLVAMGIAPFYAPDLLTAPPTGPTSNPLGEGLNRDVVTPAIFALEMAALLIVVGLVELALLRHRRRA